MNQDTALALLQTAAAQSEEESDSIVKQLMDKELQIDAFLDKFMSSRKNMHLRKLKAEKMIELVRKSKQNVSGVGGAGQSPYTGFYPSSVPYPTSGNTPYPTSGSTPYPMAPMYMPMAPGQFPQY